MLSYSVRQSIPTKATLRCCFCVFLVAGLFVGQVLGQVPAEEQRRYLAAVKRVQAGEYDRAKSELNNLIQQRSVLAPYASYFYALAAFRQKNYGQARAMLRQTQEQFPGWKKTGDVNYLLAATALEMGQYEEAIGAVQGISDASLRADINKLEQRFLPQITNLNRLKQLNKAYPNDRNVGLALIDLIQRTASDKDDLELSDRLTNRFGVPRTSTSTASSAAGSPATPGRAGGSSGVGTRTNRSKGYYNVAVLFPFRLDEFDPEKRGRSNQYAYDLYNGIKLAKAKLQEEGIVINLFAYDLDNDANRALELINSPSFQKTDLIIGPLYVEPNRIASAFANQNQIPLINPIATSSELVQNQTMSYLAQPSVAQQARKAADQAQSVSAVRKAAIYFGSTRKDSLLATAYLNELQQRRYQILDFRKVSGTSQTMADAMKLTGIGSPTVPTATAMQPATGTNVGHVFFASSNEDDGPRMLDALSRRKLSGPLIATSTAFDYYRDASSTFTRRELYLLYPDFIDNTREAVTEFEENYLAKRNNIPSVFASQGYDMMLFFGRQMAKNGVPFRNRMQMESDTDDYQLSGFKYTQSNDNQIVPIVRFEDGKLVKINE